MESKKVVLIDVEVMQKALNFLQRCAWVEVMSFMPELLEDCKMVRDVVKEPTPAEAEV